MGSLGNKSVVTADQIAQEAFGRNWDELSNQERLEATRPLVEQATAKGSMTQQHLQEILILGPTFTNRDVNRVEKELDSSVGEGSIISATEPGRSSPITQRFTKRGNSWHYERIDDRSGEFYENRSVPTMFVALRLLEDPEMRSRWRFYK